MPGKPRGRDGVDEGFIERLSKLYRLIRKYSRLEVEGLENIPDGKGMLVANHTGWAGLDFANLYVTLHDDLDREIYTAVHPNWFNNPLLSEYCRKLGMYEAGVTESVKILDQEQLVLFFPEGERGNFKPIWQLYQLQPFKPGFARTAMAAAAPIIPTVIVGGEEANPTLARLEFTREMLGVGLPVPATLLPLPVKWRIRFLEPIHVDDYISPETADADVIEELRSDVEDRMRQAVANEVEARGHPFL